MADCTILLVYDVVYSVPSAGHKTDQRKWGGGGSKTNERAFSCSHVTAPSIYALLYFAESDSNLTHYMVGVSQIHVDGCTQFYGRFNWYNFPCIATVIEIDSILVGIVYKHSTL